jgi:hypothetical protein
MKGGKVDFNIFAKNLARLGLNFNNLVITKDYIEFMYGELERSGFADRDFLRAIESIISHETTLFNLPSKAIFLKYGGKKVLSIEQIASIEVGRIIEASELLFNSILFDNETTNETVHQYGGIGRINFDLFDDYNKNKRERVWVEKELKDKWLNCYDADLKSKKPSYLKSSRLNSSVYFIGDQNKCGKFLAEHKLTIDYKRKPRSECAVIGDILRKGLFSQNKNQSITENSELKQQSYSSQENI